MKDPDWLINSTPREVQMEALRRSYGGFKTRDTLSEIPRPTRLHAGRATGWGHYLEMRLGKSALAIAEFELFARDDEVEGMVVAAPASFKEGWMKEAEKAGTLSMWRVFDNSCVKEMHQFAGMARSKGVPWVAVINYESIRLKESKETIISIMSKGRVGLVIDESIKIKNHTSLQTKAVLAIAKEAYFVRNLSGLFMTKGPQDVYPQLRAMRRMNGLNFYSFRNRFCKMGGYKAKKIVGAKNEGELRAELNSTSFIAKKADWGLKPAEREVIRQQLTMTPKQKRVYKEIDREFVSLLDTGEEISVDMVLTKLIKLQQISSGFVRHEDKVIAIEDPKKTPKMRQLMDMMEEIDGKVIIVYVYKASGDLLLEQLAEFKPAVIRSADWMRKNGITYEDEKARFNEDPECRVAIVQIVAGKYGHTLIGAPGDRCRYMAFYEHTFSLDDRSQIEMRNTYFDQDWANTYVDFVSSPVEARALKALQDNEDLVNAVLYGRDDEDDIVIDVG